MGVRDKFCNNKIKGVVYMYEDKKIDDDRVYKINVSNQFIEDLSWAKANALLNEAVKDLSKADLVPKNFPIKSITEESVNEKEAKYYLDKAVRELAKLRLAPSSDIEIHNILQELSEKTNVWSRYIKKEDYDIAYNEYKSDFKFRSKHDRVGSFLKEVIKEYGINMQFLQAVESVAKLECMSSGEVKDEIYKRCLKEKDFTHAYELVANFISSTNDDQKIFGAERVKHIEKKTFEQDFSELCKKHNVSPKQAIKAMLNKMADDKNKQNGGQR